MEPCWSRWARVVRSLGKSVAVIVAGVVGAGASVHAQTDFYNTSTGRPLRVEDAMPVEFRAIEIDVAPLRIDRFGGGTRHWSLHPETTIGILPRTQLQIGVPIAYIDAPATSSRGVAGLEISMLHSLNAETSVPALALAADVVLPVGPLGGEATFGSLKAILTRTLPWARVHANAQITAGPGTTGVEEASAGDERDLSRWLAGIAIDKTFPLHSLLVTAEAVAERPIGDEPPIAWSAGTGFRYQLTPRWAMDAGAGRRFTGNDRAWYMTLGSAYAFGVR